MPRTTLNVAFAIACRGGGVRAGGADRAGAVLVGVAVSLLMMLFLPIVQ